MSRVQASQVIYGSLPAGSGIDSHLPRLKSLSREGFRTAGRDAKPVGRYAVPELLVTPVCASLPEMPRLGTQYSPNCAGGAAMG